MTSSNGNAQTVTNAASITGGITAGGNSLTGHTGTQSVSTITGSGGTTSGPTGGPGGTIDNQVAVGALDPWIALNYIIKF